MNFENVNWHYFPLKLWSVKKRIKSCFVLYKGKPKGQIILTLWKKLEKHQKDAQKIGIKQTILIGTDSDVFGDCMNLTNSEIAPVKEDSYCIRERLFINLDKGVYPNLIFLFLTIHPEEIAKSIPEKWLTDMPGNVMFGTSGNSHNEIATNISRMSNAPGAKFILVQPDYTRLDLYDILKANKVELVIQGDRFQSDLKVVDFDGLWKIRDDANRSKVQYYFKHENLLFGN